MTKEQQEFASELTLMKHKAMSIGLYRTGRLLEIPIIEIGWELQNVTTPAFQQKRQLETLNPG